MKQIFINLVVADVNKSMDFYTQLGFTNNPQFSDEQGKCMVWSEHIFVMLLSPDKFKTFTEKPLADTKKTDCSTIFTFCSWFGSCERNC